MDYINNIHVEPGTYTDSEGRKVVVIDYITHKYNSTADLVEPLTDPDIVLRPLLSTKEYTRETYPISVFKNRFVKI
jgi:hypothetical protein